VWVCVCGSVCVRACACVWVCVCACKRTDPERDLVAALERLGEIQDRKPFGVEQLVVGERLQQLIHQHAARLGAQDSFVPSGIHRATRACVVFGFNIARLDVPLRLCRIRQTGCHLEVRGPAGDFAKVQYKIMYCNIHDI
jgi:hypothetical protein